MPLYSRALGAHACNDRARNVSHQPIAHLRIHDLVGGISAHAAGIRALIVIEDALVVLRRHQRHYALAIAHHQKRQLITLQTFFQHDTRAGFAQHLAAEHVFGGALCFILGLRDDHTFAGGEAVGLHHNRCMEELQRLVDFFLAGADGILRRRDAVPLHELLGEALARFQPGGGARGPEDRPAPLLKFIHHAQRQGQLGSDHGDVGCEFAGELHQRIEALQVGSDTLRIGRNAAVTRSAVELLDPRRLPQLPHDRMFATTATEDKYLHWRDSLKAPKSSPHS